jgi:hypothetical protein
VKEVIKSPVLGTEEEEIALTAALYKRSLNISPTITVFVRSHGPHSLRPEL